MSKLNLKPAHDALQTLLQEIAAAGEENLPPTRGTIIPQRGVWLKSLKETRAALADWCDGFFLEVSSKK
jgi:hypothetical protein